MRRTLVVALVLMASSRSHASRPTCPLDVMLSASIDDVSTTGLAHVLAIVMTGCVTASAPVHGRVVATRIEGGLGEVPDTVFVVEFTSGGARRCTITGYAIVWGTGVLAGRMRCRAGDPVEAGLCCGAPASCSRGRSSGPPRGSAGCAWWRSLAPALRSPEASVQPKLLASTAGRRRARTAGAAASAQRSSLACFANAPGVTPTSARKSAIRWAWSSSPAGAAIRPQSVVSGLDFGPAT